jgi:hypothetical protein
MWKGIQSEAFLFRDSTYTYSLTMYVQKDFFSGPQHQKDVILRLLRTKRATDRFWATDIVAEQPPDCCDPPEAIKGEAERQKLRRKRLTEQREDVITQGELRQLSLTQQMELQELQFEADIRRATERSIAETHLLTEQAETRLRLDVNAEQESQRLHTQRQTYEYTHRKNLDDLPISTPKILTLENLDEEQQKEKLLLEFGSKEMAQENEGLKARFAIEGGERSDVEANEKKRFDRDVARMNVQKSLVEGQVNPAALTQQVGRGEGQRQIGYVSEDVSSICEDESFVRPSSDD